MPLTLRVINCRDLKKGDLHSSDPYVQIITSTEMRQTKIIKKDLNPNFNETFTFENVYEGEMIRFIVYDYDEGKQPDYLGETSYSLQLQLCYEKKCRKVLKFNTKGNITIELFYIEKYRNEELPPNHLNQINNQIPQTIPQQIIQQSVNQIPMTQMTSINQQPIIQQQIPQQYEQSYQIQQQYPSYTQNQQQLPYQQQINTIQYSQQNQFNTYQQYPSYPQNNQQFENYQSQIYPQQPQQYSQYIPNQPGYSSF